MKQKTRFKNFENISLSVLVHEWPIYRYRPQKSHISRSLFVTDISATSPYQPIYVGMPMHRSSSTCNCQFNI